MTKICEMDGVREYSEGFPVEFWFDDDRGRSVLIARNQDGYDCVSIDVDDLVRWLRFGPHPMDALNDDSRIVRVHGPNPQRNPPNA